MADRFEIVVEEDFMKLIRQAAEEAGGLSMSAYARQAIVDKMRRDGFKPKETVKPAHRPKGSK